MTAADTYLIGVLNAHRPKDLTPYANLIAELKTSLLSWGRACEVEIINSGSRAKGTAVTPGSDVDFLVSLMSSCDTNDGRGLQGLYDSLHAKLVAEYRVVRKQNVSFRIELNDLEVDVTPGRKQPGSTTYHSLYVSKIGSWRQTNIQKHISDISNSGRLDEIKLAKIWREQNGLEFPSIYLEYVICDQILYNKAKGCDYLASNFLHVLDELRKTVASPLSSRIVDPANTANILSDLMTDAEKNQVQRAAAASRAKTTWGEIVW